MYKRQHDRWLCATHNVSLCIECAGVHRALGAGISFVRSERLDGSDTTSDNAAFAAFLEAHGVPRREWLAAGRVTRYYTPVADLWRRRSDAAARLRAVEPPDPELVKRYEAAKAPAIWTPDKDAPTCQLCRRKFSYYYRRHHCRGVRALRVLRLLSQSLLADDVAALQALRAAAGAVDPRAWAHLVVVLTNSVTSARTARGPAAARRAS